MRQSSPLLRQWTLLRALSAQQQGVTVQDLARELEVTEKTIRRDLQTIASAGFPLDEELLPHGQKAWRLRYPDGAPGLSFTWDEALALYLGRRFLDPLAGTYLGQAAQRAFAKIRAGLKRGTLKYIDRLGADLHLVTAGSGDYSSQAELVDELLRAVVDRRMTIITYQSQKATEPVEYEIHPYGLGSHKNSLYLIAWSSDHEKILTFKVDRIDTLEVSGLAFQRPDDFDLKTYFAGSFGIFHGDGEVTVRLRFAPQVARYVQESRWHASQILTKQRDGSLLAEFQLSTTEEIKRWALSFGSSCRVLEPAELREEVAIELRETLDQYAATAEPESSLKVRGPSNGSRHRKKSPLIADTHPTPGEAKHE